MSAEYKPVSKTLTHSHKLWLVFDIDRPTCPGEITDATGYNVTDNPLPTREVEQTAKSVAKWVFKHFNSDEFRAVQAARGAKKGQKTREELCARVQPHD